MSTTYVQHHVRRTSRNLLVVNGLVLLLLAFFTVFILAGVVALQRLRNQGQAQISAINGSDVLGASEAVNLSHPTPLSAGAVNED